METLLVQMCIFLGRHLPDREAQVLNRLGNSTILLASLYIQKIDCSIFQVGSSYIRKMLTALEGYVASLSPLQHSEIDLFSIVS